MAIKKILTVPNPILRQKSKPVKKISSKGGPAFGWDKKIKQLVVDLINTAKAAKEPKGLGLSAIQIGKPVRVFVIKKGRKFVPFINPKIVWRSPKKVSQVLEKEKIFMEGCLSIPSYYGFVNRPYAIKLKWQDLKGKAHEEKFEDKEACFIQHELDHLNGVLFVDRILEQGGKIYQLEKNKEGKEAFVEVEFI